MRRNGGADVGNVRQSFAGWTLLKRACFNWVVLFCAVSTKDNLKQCKQTLKQRNSSLFPLRGGRPQAGNINPLVAFDVS